MSAHNNSNVNPIFQGHLNTWLGSLMPAGSNDSQHETGYIEDAPDVCDHCGSPDCDGYIDNCPQHPDKVAAREEKAEADAIWNARFAKAQDAGKYGEEL